MRINDYCPECADLRRLSAFGSGRLPTTVRQQPEKALCITTAGATISRFLVSVSVAWGAQKISATGKVYNLNNLSRFLRELTRVSATDSP